MTHACCIHLQHLAIPLQKLSQEAQYKKHHAASFAPNLASVDCTAEPSYVHPTVRFAPFPPKPKTTDGWKSSSHYPNFPGATRCRGPAHFLFVEIVWPSSVLISFYSECKSHSKGITTISPTNASFGGLAAIPILARVGARH